jgi:hypothetical protein
MGTSVDRFMDQQGFTPDEASRRRWHFRALLFQPSIVGALMVVAITLQSRILFFALAAVLIWNVIVPRLNPFERFYDWAIGSRQGKPRLQPAPAPRRFAQGMAATFMTAAGLSLTFGWLVATYALEVLLVVAFSALLFGRFCLGAYIFHVLSGRRQFANATCPWSS